jgi:hypothetical protein
MYAARKISVWNSGKSKLISTITPDANGEFSITLSVGTYVLSMVKSSGPGSISGLPDSVTIRAGLTSNLSIAVDTGIR